jgi:hypothetical protein
MDSDRIRQTIRDNAAEIVRLHTRIHETYALRRLSPEKWSEWEYACAEFHGRIDSLGFPGGFEGAFERILAGDPTAMEAAVCFLEVRPCFFRSGYMFKDILRKCKRAPLSREQSARLEAVMAGLAEWRRRKNSKAEVRTDPGISRPQV